MTKLAGIICLILLVFSVRSQSGSTAHLTPKAIKCSRCWAALHFGAACKHSLPLS